MIRRTGLKRPLAASWGLRCRGAFDMPGPRQARASSCKIAWNTESLCGIAVFELGVSEN